MIDRCSFRADVQRDPLKGRIKSRIMPVAYKPTHEANAASCVGQRSAI